MLKINRFHWLLVLLVLISGQSSASPIFLDSIDDFRHLAPFTLVIEDPDHEYDVDDILNETNLKSEFVTVESEIPYMDFTRSTYWMKLEVANNTTEQLNYYLELARPVTNIVRLFVFDSDRELLNIHETGDDYKFSEREYEQRKFIFPETFPPNSNRILIIQTTSDGEILKLPVKMWNVVAFTEYVSMENFYFGIYYGIFILVIILFTMMGLASGEKLYVYFIIYVFLLAVFQLSLDGMAYQLLWRENPWLGNHAILIFAALSMIAMLLYISKYFDFKSSFPGYYKGYKTFIFGFSICLILSLLDGAIYALMFPILNGISFIAVIYVLVGIIRKSSKNNRFEIPVLLAFLALSLSSIIFILANVDIIQSEFLASNVLKIGSATEVVFLAIAMAGRYKQSHLDKLSAQKQAMRRLEELNDLKSKQTEKLESEVMERTKEIRDKNEQLSSKNEEIINSINYAKRLQDALLPNEITIKKFLPNTAIFFQPKDIVSGDFYWIIEHNGLVFFAVADCTGHGVPGAMLSILGFNSLNRCVKEFGLNNSGDILDKLRELIIESFDSEKLNMKDGLDIALCVWNKESQIQYSGAYNSLYIIRDNELQVIKADRQPIGLSKKTNPFTSHLVQIKTGDSVILFTDGYADQFGGADGGKYKYSNFKDLLLKNNNKPSREWNSSLDEDFRSWKKDVHQIDDVCVLAVRF